MRVGNTIMQVMDVIRIHGGGDDGEDGMEREARRGIWPKENTDQTRTNSEAMQGGKN